jgi:hypothetical protein
MRPFSKALASGHKAEIAWVEQMRDRNCAIAHGRKIVAKNHCKQTGHVDTPDAAAVVGIEIKERSCAFTDPKSFPYDTVFVDDLRGMSKEQHRNLIYVYVSKPTGAFVWLTILDRNDEWKNGVTFDKGRQHEVHVLEAPKSALRHADELMSLIYPLHLLELIDGETGAFRSGGGATEKVDRYVASTHPDVGERAGGTAPKGSQRLG